MKKIVTLLLAVVMIASLAIAASAETFLGNGKCEVELDIKKADPANVVKDGIIGEGEYEKFDISKDDLAINFINANCYLTADAMAEDMEFYFSWDEVHGFNFAVKYDAYPLAAAEKLGYDAASILDGFKTTVEQPVANADGLIMDNFCFNVGVVFASGWDEDNNTQSFYYAVGEKIQTPGSYLTGHWNQLGADGQYEAVGGKDFEFGYNGTTVTCEWSIPFAEFDFAGAGAGSEIDFSIAACAGDAEVEDELEGNAANFFNAGNSWSVALGQKCFLVQSTSDAQRAKAHLLNDVIPGPAAPATSENTPDQPVETPATSQNVATTPAPTQAPESSVVTEVVTSQVAVTNEAGETETNEAGEIVTEVVTEVVTSIVTAAPTDSANGNKAPVTGDPMVIAAVVAAISACGVVVAKKRK